jgi:hypothetical protein
MTGMLPAPRFAAAGLERVGFALLAAATPPRLAPAYNERRGELWALVQTRRTVPSPDEFDVELRDLRDLLRDAFYLARMRCADADVRALANAARGLDAVEMAAGNAGLVP